ncbi:MAG: hypothetical protein ABI056_08820 [Caulobacteraceae bacterium]
MTDAPSRAHRSGPLVIERVLLGAVVVSAAAALLHLLREGYLPAPYFYDTFDTFMDWFNPAWWARNGGQYSIWLSVYPPLSFDFLKVFGLGACYGADPYVGRDCDWLGRIAILACYAADVGIVYLCYRTHDRRTAVTRAAAIALGLPMLYTLERGNLILPCFGLFALGLGKVLRSARGRWLAFAAAVNFKPYVLAALVAPLLRRRWRWLEGCGLAILAVYLIGYALAGAGTLETLVNDTFAFANEMPNAFLLAESYYSSSFTPFLQLLANNYPLTAILGSRPVEMLEFTLPLAIHVGQIGVLLAFAAAALRPGSVPSTRLAALGMAVVLTSTDPGGYVQLFLLFLVFFERWSGPAPAIALMAAYALSLSCDLPLTILERGVRDVWLSGRTVSYDLGLTLGQFLRPALILVIEYALSAATIMSVLRARAEPLGLAPTMADRGGAKSAAS